MVKIAQPKFHIYIPIEHQNSDNNNYENLDYTRVVYQDIICVAGGPEFFDAARMVSELTPLHFLLENCVVLKFEGRRVLFEHHGILIQPGYQCLT